jgi:hypothetical protein
MFSLPIRRPTLFANLFRTRRRPAVSRKAGPPRFRPLLEMLEERSVPSTVNWIGTANGSFTDATNWQDAVTGANRVPGAGDDAVVGINVVVTDSSTTTVNSLTMSQGQLQLTGGTFTVNNQGQNSSLHQLVVQTGATFQTAGGATNVNANSTVTGTLSVTSGATMAFAAGSQAFNTGTSLQGTGLYLLSGSTLSINAAITAPTDFEMTGGTLTGTGTYTVASGSTFNWAGNSTMNGGGTTTIASGATLTIDGPGIKTLDNYTINNAGTTTWTGAGGLTITDNATFSNTGTFNAETDQDIGGNSGTFANAGTFIKTSPGGTGTTRIFPTFNNTGTVTVTTGVLQLAGGGTNSSTFSVASGQTLQFNSSTYTLGTGAALNGSGDYDINGGSVVNDISLTVVNVTLEKTATLSGPGTLTVSTAFNWSTGGGTMNGSGTTTIESGATLTLTGPNDFVLSNYTLDNAGTTTWSGRGNLDVNAGSVFSNTGTFTVQTDANIQGSGTFSNAGTFTKTSPRGTGTTRIDPTFNNTGTVTVTSGVLQLNGGGSNSSTFSVPSGQTLQFTGGSAYTLATGATLSGAGVYDINGGLLANDISLTVVDVTLENGGTLQGPGTLTVSSTLDASLTPRIRIYHAHNDL